MTVEEVIVRYEGRLTDLQAGIASLRLPHALTATVLVIAIGLFVALGIYAIGRQASFVWPLLPVPVAAVSARRLQRNREERSRMWRLTRFYESALDRVKGNWTRSGNTGEEFSNPDHVYARDLQVVGKGSLFERLCIARTSIGRRGLAKYLLETPALGETTSRQEAVHEMRGRLDLREKVATLGEFEFFQSHWTAFEEWLESPTLSFASSLPALAMITSALLAGLVLAGFSAAVPWSRLGLWIYSLIALHAGVGLFYWRRVNRMIECVRPLMAETHVFREGLRLLEAERFQSAKLRNLAARVGDGSSCMRRLERLLSVLDQRDKQWFYLFSRLLVTGTQACVAMEQWRRDHGESLRVWIDAWAEFEALNALAAYGYENPKNTFPEFSAGEASLEACELGHPLLPQSSCVANDIELNRQVPFYVVSGSNMSGKSTLLRTIGLNSVLAFAGAPVRARSLRLSGLSIFASLSIEDSLLNGKSKFLAEVERLRRAIESTVRDRPVLFLVDEIFSGTNSRDRRIAAEAVVRTLVNRGAIGVLSTHDLTLTEIANAPGMSGANVHMGSREGGHPMDFDYRLKPGVTEEANALAIARMAGVRV